MQLRKMNKLASLILMILSLGSFWANATNLVPDACKKLSASDPDKIKYDFCVETLGSDPRSSTASLLELGVISLQMDISKAKSIEETIKQLLKDPKLDPYVKGALGDCSELYSDARVDLEDSINALKSKDFMTANVRIGSAMESASTCEEEFTEKKGKVSPLSKENADFLQLTVISLAFTTVLK